MIEVKGEISGVKGEIKEIRYDMKSMESRLSDKIDSFGNRLEEHEAKPIEIAYPRHS